MSRAIFRECPPSQSQKYYKRMLTSIENIRTVLANQIQSRFRLSDSLSLNKKTRPQRSGAVTPFLGSSSRKHKGNQDSPFAHLKSTIHFSNKEENSLYSTPIKKKKRGSLINSPYAQLQSPFEECVFDKTETVRKAQGGQQAGQRNSSRQDARRDLQGKISLQESLWLKWHLSFIKGARQNQKKHDKENALDQHRLKKQKVCQKNQEGVDGFGEVSRLQRQFEGCVLRKKGAVLEEQAALRDKMTELSYRIAKLKERQTRLCLARA